MHPKFARDLLWGEIDNDISPATHYSLSAEPLPHLPQSELQNVTANKTISQHPELCKIVCKINTEKFNGLLCDHPNQLFVHIQSVIIGLTEGFWPWAEPQDGYPATHNEPQHPQGMTTSVTSCCLNTRKRLRWNISLSPSTLFYLEWTLFLFMSTFSCQSVLALTPLIPWSTVSP